MKQIAPILNLKQHCYDNYILYIESWNNLDIWQTLESIDEYRVLVANISKSKWLKSWQRRMITKLSIAKSYKFRIN